MAAPTRALSVLLCLGVVWEWAAAADAAERGAAAAGVMAPRAEQAPELLLWQEIPTVVSASRHEEPASRAPNAVSVITADQIHQSGLMTLGDLLRLAVGVDVARISGGVYGVGVRGLYGVWENSTLVLMDGRTLYTPVWGGVQWAEQPVLLEDIERIEVVRGPGGAAWGANAANGVINIITKKPADTQGLTLSQTLTSRLDSLTYMQYSETFEKLDLRLSAGYDSMPEVGVRHGPGNHDFVRMPRASLRSIYHLDEERSLDFDAGYVDGVRGNVGLANGFTSARWFPQTHFIRTRYTHEEADDDLWYVQYFLNRTTTDMSDGGLWARYIKHDIEVQRTRRAAEQHVLTWGGNLRLDYLTNGDPFTPGLAGLRFDNRRTRNVQAGLFLQDRFEVSDQWTLVGGVRTDHNSYTGWEWAGRGTVLYHPVPEHTFRASVARAFRTPTLTDRTFNLRAGPLPFPLPPFAMLLRGNHDLNPTYVKAYEFGYAYEKQPVRLGADFFWNNYRGIVAGVPQTAPGALPAILVFGNQIDGDLYGIELSGRWRATERLQLDASYVWEQWVQQGTRSWTVRDLTTTDRTMPPQQKVMVGAQYEPADGLFLSGRMFWVDERSGPDGASLSPYARFDFGVTKKLGEHCEVSAGVLDAFDPRHDEAHSRSEQPVEAAERTWYVQFQANY